MNHQRIFIMIALLVLAAIPTYAEEQLLQIRSLGDDEYQMKFVNSAGDAYSLPLVSNENGDWRQGSDDDSIILREGEEIGLGDYFIIGSNGITRALQYTDIFRTQGESSVIFAGGSRDYEVALNAQGEGTLLLDGTAHTVRSALSATDPQSTSATALVIDLDGDGTFGGSSRIGLMHGFDLEMDFTDAALEMTLHSPNGRQAAWEIVPTPHEEVELQFDASQRLADLTFYYWKGGVDDPYQLQVTYGRDTSGGTKRLYDIEDTLHEGEKETYYIDGEKYEIALVFLSEGAASCLSLDCPPPLPGEAKFVVNGELTVALRPGESDHLASGTLTAISIDEAATFGFLAQPDDDRDDEPPRESGSEGRHRLGSADAPVVLIEFVDYEDPFGKQYHDQAHEQIIEEFVEAGKVRLSVRHFPLPFHESAMSAAEAAECVGRQGGAESFWEYHDTLFASQQDLSLPALKRYAQELGVDIAGCLDTREMAETVQNDIQDGKEAGVSGTPAFFVNGKRIIGAQPFSTFKAAIEEAIGEETPPSVTHYITVVGETSPSTDVVNAANFAGYMKRELDIEFTGRTTSQLREELQEMDAYDRSEFLDNSVIVRTVGSKHAILEGSGDLRPVVRQAERYLSASGFGRVGEALSREALMERWILAELDQEGFPIERVGQEFEQEVSLPVPKAGGSCDSGCIKEKQCIPYGLRTKNGEPIYCDISGEMLPQKEEEDSCQNNYECLSNQCSNGACVDIARELREQKGILQSILDWLRGIF